MKLGAKLRLLKQRFAKVSAERFLYNDSRELKEKTNAVAVFFLLHSEGYGYAVREFHFRRAVVWDSVEWGKWVRTKLLREIIGKILEQIAGRGEGIEYQVISVIGFAYRPVFYRGSRAFPERRDTDAFGGRSKTVKKGGKKNGKRIRRGQRNRR